MVCNQLLLVNDAEWMAIIMVSGWFMISFEWSMIIVQWSVIDSWIIDNSWLMMMKDQKIMLDDGNCWLATHSCKMVLNVWLLRWSYGRVHVWVLLSVLTHLYLQEELLHTHLVVVGWKISIWPQVSRSYLLHSHGLLGYLIAVGYFPLLQSSLCFSQ